MARLDWIFVAINTFGVCMLINSIIGIYRHISAPHLGILKPHSNIKLCTCRLVLGEELNLCTCRLVDVFRRNCSCVATCRHVFRKNCSCVATYRHVFRRNCSCVATCRLVFRMYTASASPEH